MPHAVSPVFGPALTGVREARQWAAETTSGWGLDGERDTLLLVVSELATNAMLHAVSTARVILDYDPADGVLEVAVEDTELLESSTAPGALDVGHQYVAERDPERLDGGRGLLIIHALAQQWGVRATETGKQVWLQLPVTPVLHDPVRLAAVDRLLAVGIESQVLVGLVELARELLGARHAQASLRSDVDVIAAESGTNADRSPMQRRQLTDLTLATGLGVLPDVGADDRVSGVDDSVGSYLGVPLVVGELAVGVLAVDDSYPRPWTPNDVGVLERLARSASAELSLHVVTAELAMSAARLDVSLAAADIGGYELDQATGELWWDERLIEMFGYDAKTFSPHLDSFIARVHPDDRQRIAAAIDAVFASQGQLAEEYRITLPGERTRWITARGRCVVDDLGRLRLVGAAYDSTQVHQERDRVVQVLETMTDGFYSLDRDWRFTYVNAPAERILGRTRSDLVGLNVWHEFPAAVGTAFQDQFEHVMSTGEPKTFEEYYPAPIDARFELRAWATPEGVSVIFHDISERHQLQLDRERALLSAQQDRDRVEMLADLTRALGTTLDVQESVSRLLHLLVPRFADWSSVTLVDEDRRRSESVARHRDPALRADVERFAALHVLHATENSRSHQVVLTGQPNMTNGATVESLSPGWADIELTDLVGRLGIANVMVIPLSSRDRVLGVVALVGNTDRAPFTDSDLATATEIGRRAGLAIDNAQLYTRQRSAAEMLQRHLLPPLPDVEGLLITARYLPAAQEAQVGGDFYWGAVQAGGQTLVAIGDVCGHDLTATSWQAQLAPLLRGFAFESKSGPASVLTRVDRAMRGLAIDTMATAVLASINAPETDDACGSRRLRWSNAGHLAPLLLRADGHVRSLDHPPELLLGLDPSTLRSDHEQLLMPGDTVLLFTDGLVERRGSDPDDDLARLCGVLSDLASLPLDELADVVVAKMIAGATASDDVALIAVRVQEAP